MLLQNRSTNLKLLLPYGFSASAGYTFCDTKAKSVTLDKKTQQYNMSLQFAMGNRNTTKASPLGTRPLYLLKQVMWVKTLKASCRVCCRLLINDVRRVHGNMPAMTGTTQAEVQACCDKNGAHIASIVGRFFCLLDFLPEPLSDEASAPNSKNCAFFFQKLFWVYS